MSTHIEFLRIPLHKLYYIDNIEEFSGLTEKDISSLKSEYTVEEMSEIIKSVHWAVQNKEHDFNSLLPNLNFSNEDIYKYLTKLERSLAKL
jgi:hypothetical protein